MDIESVRRFCLRLPGTSEQVQWEHLVFKVGGKMFAMVNLEPGGHWLSFKCDDEEFVTLQEVEGVDPAAYLARAKWVSVASPRTMPAAECARLLRRAHELVCAKLPRKIRDTL